MKWKRNKLIAYLMIQLLLPLPLWLSRLFIVRSKREHLLIPTQHIRVQFQRVTSFDVVFSAHMQVMQFVNVSGKGISVKYVLWVSAVNIPQIHLLPIYLILIEIEQVYGTSHAFISIFVALHHTTIVQQSLKKLRYGRYESHTLFGPVWSFLFNALE